jgi:polyisoprenoid-binding protein YceI
MIDKDGTSRYSKIVAVQLLPNSISNYKFTIYPNPATTFVQIHCDKKITGKVDIAITDATGKVVYRKNVETNGALISISTSQLKAGAYFIKAAWSGETFVEKFIVSK